MGIDLTTGLAFTKSQIAAGGSLPESGTVFLSLADRDKEVGLEAARGFESLGLEIVATSGTARHLRANGVSVRETVAKIGEDGTDAVGLIASGAVQLLVNSPRGRGPRADGENIRGAAAAAGIPLLTTASAALAAARGLADWHRYPLAVRTLQEYHRGVTGTPEEAGQS
jgi:carbamoyl-phosphate synthase large subunit